MAKKKSKSFWKSKTLWFNVLAGSAAFFGQVPDILPQEALIPTLTGLNIALRLITNQGVGISGSE